MVTMIEKTNDEMLQNADTIRICRECGEYMLSGYIDEDYYFHYYCSEECLDKALSEEEKELGFEYDTLYYTEWYDSDVFVVLDNQYATLEDAEYVKKNHGDHFTKIEVKTFDFDYPVYKIVDGKQVEIDELTYI